MKLCINCAHHNFLEAVGSHYCVRPVGTSLVTGKEELLSRPCVSERRNRHGCGEYGVKFKPKHLQIVEQN